MPYEVTLEPRGWRGDSFERAIALTKAGTLLGQRIPTPDTEVQAIIAAYPLLEAQFRAQPESPDVLISLSSSHVDALTGKPDIRIERAFTWPDGTTGPALVLFFQPMHTRKTIESCSWDVQFSGPGRWPQTWIYGQNWGIDQDTTRTAADTASP